MSWGNAADFDAFILQELAQFGSGRTRTQPCPECGSNQHCQCHTYAFSDAYAEDNEVIDQYVDALALDEEADAWEDNSGVDYHQGVTPSRSTDEVAGILRALIGSADNNRIGIENIRHGVAFGVGRQGAQAGADGQIISKPDGQFVNAQGVRVNFEVDRPGNIHNHIKQHQRAMELSQANVDGKRRHYTPPPLADTRSVFMTTDRNGQRIEQIRHVVYRWQNGQVVAQPINIPLKRPLTLAEAANHLRRYTPQRSSVAPTATISRPMTSTRQPLRTRPATVLRRPTRRNLSTWWRRRRSTD